jgi:RNA polymerase-binding transcription factor DksA
MVSVELPAVLIDKARLRAVPHATLSLEAKLGLVKPNQD